MRVLTVLLLASVSFAPVSLMAQAGGTPQTARETAPVNLLSTRTDPRTGKQTFTATKVTWAIRTRCLTSLRHQGDGHTADSGA